MYWVVYNITVLHAIARQILVNFRGGRVLAGGCEDENPSKDSAVHGGRGRQILSWTFPRQKITSLFNQVWWTRRGVSNRLTPNFSPTRFSPRYPPYRPASHPCTRMPTRMSQPRSIIIYMYRGVRKKNSTRFGEDPSRCGSPSRDVPNCFSFPSGPITGPRNRKEWFEM